MMSLSREVKGKLKQGRREGRGDGEPVSIQWLFRMLLKKVTMLVMVNILVTDVVIVRLGSDSCECLPKLVPDSVDITQK